MQRRLAILGLVGAILGVLPGSVLGADSGSITATVSVVAPCITVGDPIDYGTQAFAPSGQTPSGTSGTSTYTNCSGSTEQVAVQGTDAASTAPGSTAAWTLQSQLPCQAITTPNQYRVEVKDYQVVSLALSSSVAQVIDPALSTSTPQTLQTYLNMPCSGSAGAGETMQFTISVIAYF